MFYKHFRLPKAGHRKQTMRLHDTSQSYERTKLGWNTCEDFFSYTRGRFVRNERYEMSQRYVRFDMEELTNIAAKSVGSERCVRVEKFSDGMFNKTFLFTMQDGKEVVEKVPNPNAGQPYYTTASEVATINFIRQFKIYTPLLFADQ